MNENSLSDPTPTANRTKAERRSERDLFVTRRFNAPARIVFEAWTRPALFVQWWAPKSSGLSIVACEMDVRVGGGYRLEFGHPASARPMVFFGSYVEVVPNARLAWTNEESADGALTTVTFEEKDGKTVLVMHERYPTRAALDASFEGMEAGMPEQFEQLDALLVTLGAS